MPFDPGTLQGFDQLLSVSQEAIQQQLKMLYLTEVDPPIKDGPTHLINHEMSFHLSAIHPKTGKTYFQKDGIDAYVCCPKIELGGQSMNDEEGEDKYRIAVIRFKFRKAEDWEVTEEQVKAGKKRDSIFTYKLTYPDDDGNDVTEYPEININGWEISWDTLLDRKDIQDVFKEIIGPAESENSHVAISQDAKKELKAVGSKNFQISTIFCAMQSARLVRSFCLVNENGNRPFGVKDSAGEPVGEKNLIEQFMIMINNRFRSQNQSKTEGLGPTPDNPFVLGYTLSSKVPQLEEVNPAAAAAKIPTPDFFVPKTFQVNLSPGNQYCEGTMNYCMQTFRAMKPPHFNEPGLERQIVEGAGRFETNVFDRLKTKATPGSAEGALFFAQDIFINHWIGSSVAPLFYLHPVLLGHTAATHLEANYEPIKQNGLMYGMLSSNLQRSLTKKKEREYKMTDSARSDRRIIAFNAANDPTESAKMEYDSTVKISYENLYPLQDDDDDLKRRLKVTIGSYTHLKVKIFRRLALSHVTKGVSEIARGMFSAFGGDGGHADPLSDADWEESIDMDVWFNFKYTFQIGTSATNRGSFEISNTHAEHLDENGGMFPKGCRPPSDEAPGLWEKMELHNWTKTFNFAFCNEKTALGNMAESVAKNGKDMISGALEDLVKSLGSTVIFPAGNVFMFKGFSTDSDGNVFTAINYDTTTDDEVQMQRAKDILHTNWQSPIAPKKT